MYARTCGWSTSTLATALAVMTVAVPAEGDVTSGAELLRGCGALVRKMDGGSIADGNVGSRCIALVICPVSWMRTGSRPLPRTVSKPSVCRRRERRTINS